MRLCGAVLIWSWKILVSPLSCKGTEGDKSLERWDTDNGRSNRTGRPTPPGTCTTALRAPPEIPDEIFENNI